MAMPKLLTRKRLLVLLIGVSLLFFVLIIRLGYLQTVRSEELQARAQDQWTKETVLAAKRGRILDRNGNVLAQSASADTIVFRPVSMKAAVAKAKTKQGLDLSAEQLNQAYQEAYASVAQRLADLVGVDYQTSYERMIKENAAEVVIKRQISEEQADYILENSDDFPGVALVEDNKRYYPRKDFLTQVLGYTTIDGVGQEGLEKALDEYLRGKAGEATVQTDPKGRELPYSESRYDEAENGLDAVLTIDYVIQSIVEKAVKDAYAQYLAADVQCIVMDPNTCAVLGMANAPDFDLNSVPREDLTQLANLSRNACVTDVYEPGSTFKIITTASALEENVVTPQSTFYDPGYRVIDGVKIKCWRSYNPHGSETLTQGLQNSCNPVFMDLALRMGRDVFYDYIYSFGFGQQTGIDYPGESKGIVTPVKYITNVDLACIGFGQSIAVTPLQLITAASAVVNGGNLMKPYLLKELRNEAGGVVETIQPQIVRRVISDSTSFKMREMLESVVKNSVQRAQIEGYRVGGKTGTAQKFENGKLLEGKSIASFIGFAPANDPQVIVLFIVDEAKFSSEFGSVIAAPYAKQILEETLAYLKIPKSSDTEPSETAPVPDLSGLTVSEAVDKLTQAGFRYLLNGDGNHVLDQMPFAGVEMIKGSEVLLYVEDSGVQQEDTITVPDLTGKTPDEARSMLSLYGLRIKPQGGSGAMKWQDPQAGQVIEPGATVTVQFE